MRPINFLAIGLLGLSGITAHTAETSLRKTIKFFDRPVSVNSEVLARPCLIDTRNCDLSSEEERSVHGYTANWYRSLNYALRTRDRNKLAKERLEIQALLSGLHKLRPYQGLVKRSVYLDHALLSDHTPDSIVSYQMFLSTSVINPSKRYPGNVLYLIKSSSCRFISKFSAYPDDYEVLCLPATQFRVRYREVKKGILRIYMEEIGQSFDLDAYIDG